MPALDSPVPGASFSDTFKADAAGTPTHQPQPLPPGALARVKVDPIRIPLAGGDEIRRLGIAAMFDDQAVRVTCPNFDGLEKLQAVLPDARGGFPDSNAVELKFQRTMTPDGRPLDDHEAYLNADHIDLDAVKKFGIKLITRTNVGTFTDQLPG